jgi:hypothetical protein
MISWLMHVFWAQMEQFSLGVSRAFAARWQLRLESPGGLNGLGGQDAHSYSWTMLMATGIQLS